ncbi:MAG: efflux RND transporter periplasmic adaptor subunit [Candidatus Omnitrophica bacterium]|nr:efflux RND transporter periplasmic adaptor subunit [Candidatus Omnitrophota bacterium]
MKKIDAKNIFNKLGLRKRNYVIIAICLLIVGLILSRTMNNIQRIIFGKKAPKEATELEIAGEATPVKVYKVRKISFKDTLPAMGTIKGFKEVDLKFQISGMLESFNFEDGERIQEGDIIANLNQRDALIKLKYSELEQEKNKKLFEIGAIDKVKLEQSKLEYESAKSDFEKTNIYAVSDGMLGSRIMDIGSYVTPNDKVGIFVDISNVYGEFKIIEKDSPKIKLGQKCEVFIDAYPNKAYKGTVDSISPVLEGRTRTQNVKIELKNTDLELKPGMFLRTLISTYEKDNALIIPTSAFKKKDADYFVYIVHKKEMEKPAEEEKEEEKQVKRAKRKKEDQKEEEKEPVLDLGTVEVRQVEIAYLTQDAAEISKGLEEGEIIIVEAFQDFKDNDLVEISEEQETVF